MSLDIKTIIKILWNRFWIIVLCVIIGGLAAFSYTAFLVTPMYSSSATLYVYSKDKPTSETVTVGDIGTSQKLLNTYMVIIQNRTVLQQVINKLDLNMSEAQLKSMLALSAVGETEILQIKVTGPDPQQAADIANAITEFAPAEIDRMAKVGSVGVNEAALPAARPFSPNVKNNTMIGMLLGAVLAVFLILVLEMLDNTVRSEEDIEEKYHIPVLVAIPELEATGKKGEYSYEYK